MQSETETTTIELSRGRILAETLRAPHPVPEMNRNGQWTDMPCGILISETRRLNTKSAEIYRKHRCGHAIQNAVPRGSAVRIMTGAPMPPGTIVSCPWNMSGLKAKRSISSGPSSGLATCAGRGRTIRRGQVVLRKRASGRAGANGDAGVHRPGARGSPPAPACRILTTGDELGPGR